MTPIIVAWLVGRCCPLSSWVLVRVGSTRLSTSRAIGRRAQHTAALEIYLWSHSLTSISQDFSPNIAPGTCGGGSPKGRVGRAGPPDPPLLSCVFSTLCPRPCFATVTFLCSRAVHVSLPPPCHLVSRNEPRRRSIAASPLRPRRPSALTGWWLRDTRCAAPPASASSGGGCPCSRRCALGRRDQ